MRNYFTMSAEYAAVMPCNKTIDSSSFQCIVECTIHYLCFRYKFFMHHSLFIEKINPYEVCWQLSGHPYSSLPNGLFPFVSGCVSYSVFQTFDGLIPLTPNHSRSIFFYCCSCNVDFHFYPTLLLDMLKSIVIKQYIYSQLIYIEQCAFAEPTLLKLRYSLDSQMRTLILPNFQQIQKRAERFICTKHDASRNKNI